jgi:hypothetical protein
VIGALRASVLLETLISLALVVLVSGLAFGILNQVEGRSRGMLEQRTAADIAHDILARLHRGEGDAITLSGEAVSVLDSDADFPTESDIPSFDASVLPEETSRLDGWLIEIETEDSQFPGWTVASVSVLRDQEMLGRSPRVVRTLHALVPASSSEPEPFE